MNVEGKAISLRLSQLLNIYCYYDGEGGREMAPLNSAQYSLVAARIVYSLNI